MENKGLFGWEDVNGKTPTDYALEHKDPEMLKVFVDFSENQEDRNIK